MATKQCSKCRLIKPYELFRSNPKMTCGYDSWCKACTAIHKRDKRQQKKLTLPIFAATKTCYKCKAEKDRAAFSREAGTNDGLTNICKACRSEKHLRHYARDPDRWRKLARESSARALTSLKGTIAHRMSAQMYYCLRELKGGQSWKKLTGFEIIDLMGHLERQFLPGMSWQNLGKWHIDHIVPVADFNITGIDCPEFKACWSLSNLRPIWATENVRKQAQRTHLL